MKKGVAALAALILWFTLNACPVHSSEGLAVNLSMEPDPRYGQIIAEETYLFNVSVSDIGIQIVPGQPTDYSLWIQYTGNITAVVSINWRGFGSFDFGESISGYSFKIGEVSYNKTVPIPYGSSVWVAFNQTFEDDAFDLGAKPFETVEIRVSAKIYFEVYNFTTGLDEPFLGPLAAETSRTLKLLDDTKVDYVEGKFVDMEAEVRPLEELVQAEHVNVTAFLGYLTEMNSSIDAGDYVSALRTYSKYDQKHRAQMIKELTMEAKTSSDKTVTIGLLRQDLRLLNVSYEAMEDRYVALSITYQRKQAELEEAKRNITTAITAVFLASIAFFFLGRRSRGNPYLGEAQISEGGGYDDSEPGVRGDGS